METGVWQLARGGVWQLARLGVGWQLATGGVWQLARRDCEPERQSALLGGDRQLPRLSTRRSGG